VTGPTFVLGIWPDGDRPDPQRCRCGGWLWPLSHSLWYCPSCGLLWPPEEPKPTRLAIQLPLFALDGQGRLWIPGPRRYVDRFGNEVLRRPG